MASSTYSPLTQDPYQTDMEAWLKQLEVGDNTTAQLTPQIDTDSVGHPTVGVGIDLTDPNNLTDYLIIIGQSSNNDLRRLLNHAYVTDTTSTATQKYEATLKTYTNAHGAIPALTTDQAEQLFTQVYTEHYNDFVTTVSKPKYNIDTTNLLNSDEGLAVFSVAYNGGTPGAHVLADLNQNDFNRVDAWVQIRYLDNSGKSISLGIAKRRYEESEVFGLYNPADGSNGAVTVPLSEADAIYAEFSKAGDTLTGGEDYRDFMFHYENTYAAQGIPLANGDLGSNNLLGTDVGEYRVGTLEEELQPAADALNGYLNNMLLNPYYSGTAAFDPLDIQVALADGNSNLVAKPRNGYQLGTGSYNPSLLIAQNGNDTLDDTASFVSTANALIGGSDKTGNDVFKVGNGNDYIVAGSGNALIEGAATGSSIGSGNDTIVLGGANAPWEGGDDTVWGGSGNDVYYLGLNSPFTNIHLGSGHSTINLVDNAADVAALVVDATTLVAGLSGSAPLAESVYEDITSHKLILETSNPDGSKHLEIFELPPLVANSPSQPHLTRSLNRASVTGTEAANADVGTGTSDTSGELVIDGYTGNNLSGIQLNDSTAATIESSNLSLLAAYAPISNVYTIDGSNLSSFTYYQDGTDVPGYPTQTSIYGGGTQGSDSGYAIMAGGVASYVSAGNGNNVYVLAGGDYGGTGEVDNSPANSNGVTIQGGVGNQVLIGTLSGSETILGGDNGQDTANTTYFDGAAGNALIVGGNGNNEILGGTGQDTLVAGSVDAGVTVDSTYSIVLAGLSYYASQSALYNYEANSDSITPWDPVENVVAESGGTDFQIFMNFAGGGTPIGVLGSSLDSGAGSGSSTMPGSLIIGGTGSDYLIGNSGNDTIIGGAPLSSAAGVVQEILLGGAGNNLIYAGGGTEAIYADLNPFAAPNWANLDPTGSDTIYGGSGGNLIYGSGGNDVIYGGTGSDTVHVGNGNSYVDTGSGNSSVFGGSGNETIVADGSTDYIETGDGNTYVDASAGQTTVFAGAGNDTFEAGSGKGIYGVGTGTETYLINASSGDQYLQSVQQAGSIALDFGPDVLSSDIEVRADTSGDLALLNTQTGNSVSLEGYYTAGSTASNVSVQFSDGTTWNAAQLEALSLTPSYGNDTLVGASGSDSITAGGGDSLIIGMTGDNTLTGGTGNDTLDGGNGADTLEGGTGSAVINGGTGTETYLFNLGDGSATINENSTSPGSDTLKLGAGITTSNLTFAQWGTSGNDLMIIVHPTGSFQSSSVSPLVGASTILVPGFFSAQPSSGHAITQVLLADGTVLTPQAVQSQLAAYVGDGDDDTFVGTLSNAAYIAGDGEQVKLTGGPGNDSFYGGAGNDTMIGGTGTNVFVAGAGNDSIVSGSGTNAITLGVGNDAVVSGGTDTYYWQGNGNHTISSGSALAASGTLLFGAGISSQDLNVQVVDGALPGSEDLVLGDGGSTLTVDNVSTSDVNGFVPVDSFQFADGQVLTLAQIEQMGLSQNARQSNRWFVLGSNENVQVTGSNDSIDAQGGYDTIGGGAGAKILELDGPNNTILFGRGDGQQTVEGAQWRFQAYPWDVPLTAGNTLAFAPGVRPQDVSLVANGQDLRVQINGTTDNIALSDWFQSTNSFIMTFADGTQWSAADIKANVLYGGPQVTNAQLTAQGNGPQLYNPAGGNDTVSVNPGDTVLFGHGYGDDTIESSSYGNNGTYVQMRPDVLPSDVTVALDGNGDLIMTLADTGEQLTLQAFVENAIPYPLSQVPISAPESAMAASLSTPSMQSAVHTASAGVHTYVRVGGGGGPPPPAPVQTNIQGIQFADGSTWNLATLANMLLSPHSGNNFITDFTGGNNQLQGEGGADTLIGGSGNDTLVAGNGNDVLMSTTGNDLMQLGTGNDFAVGGRGNDTFAYNVGDGNDTLIPGDLQLYRQGSGQPSDTGPGSELLQLGAGITPGDIRVSRVNANLAFGEVAAGDLPADLLLTFKDTGRTTTIQDYFSHVESGGQYPTIQFADGTQWLPSDILPMTLTDDVGGQTLYGMAGNDLMSASAGNDTIYAGTGNATINGGTGNDLINDGQGTTTLLFGNGSGRDTFEATENPQNDIVQFAAEVTPQDISVTLDANYYELKFSLNAGADILTVPLAENASYHFADGTVWSYQDAQNIAAQQAAAAGGGSVPTEPGDGNWAIMSPQQLIPELVTLIGSGVQIGAVSSNGVVLATDQNPSYPGNVIGMIAQSGSSTVTPRGVSVGLYDASASDYALMTNTGATTSPSPVQFTYEAGSGSCAIVNYDPSNFQLNFSSGISPSEVSLQQDGSDSNLLLNVKNATGAIVGSVTIDDYVSDLSLGTPTIKPFSVHFADGTTWDSATIYSMYLQSAGDHYLTSPGGDTVTAETGYTVYDDNNASNLIYLGDRGVDLTLAGFGDGSNTIVAGSGADTFSFLAQDGHDQWSVVQQFNSADVVDFGPDVTPSQLQASKDSSGDLILSVSSIQGSQKLVIDNYFAGGGDGGGTFEFANGTRLTGADFDAIGAGTASGYIENQLIQDTSGSQIVSGVGYSGNDTLQGVAGDTLIAGAGNDLMISGGGAETFSVGHSMGNQTIMGGSDSADIGTLQFAADVTVNDVAVVRPDATGTLEFILKDTGQTITVPNYFQNAANTGIQDVTFADGTTWSAADILRQAQQPSSYDNYLLAQPGDDVLTAGSGHDTLISDGGSDTLTGGSGTVTMEGGAGQDLMQPGTGNASLIGGSGAETFQFGTGFGQDTLIADTSSSASNAIQFIDGITAADVSLIEPNASDLELAINGTQSSILLPDGLTWGAPPALAAVNFADGTSWNWTQLLQMLSNRIVASSTNETIAAGPGSDTLIADSGSDSLVGGTGDDTFVGGSGADTFVAGSGNDELLAGTGPATYVFGAGSGIDTVAENQTASTNSVLQIAGDSSIANAVFTSLDPSAFAIHVTRDGKASEVIVRDPNVADGAPPAGGVVTFGDGTSITAARVEQLLTFANGGEVEVSNNGDDTLGGATTIQIPTLFAAGNGNDTLFSNNGTDTLVGGEGNDQFVGGANTDLLIAGTGDGVFLGGSGAETFAFGASFGAATITVNAAATSNTIQFLGATTRSSVTFATQGNDLVISLIGSTGADGNPSTVTLLGHFAGGAPVTDVGSVVFGDGSSLTMTQINQMLQQSNGASVQYSAMRLSGPTFTVGHVSPAAPADRTVIRGTVASHSPNAPTKVTKASGMPFSRGMATPSTPSVEHGAPRLTSTTSAQVPAVGSQPVATGGSAISAPLFQPDSGVGGAGAPVDRIASDPDDGAIQATPVLGGSLLLNDEGQVSNELNKSSGRTAVGTKARQTTPYGTANAANDMTKALLARGSVLQEAMDKSVGAVTTEVQLQDGTLWSLSALDQMLATTTVPAGKEPSRRVHALNGAANLAHVQLISAMASFSATGAGEMSLMPTGSEAYAIVLAAQGH